MKYIRNYMDWRVRKWFALFPAELYCDGEIRWLETVYVKQRLKEFGFLSEWVNVKFLTKEEYYELKKKWKLERTTEK